MSTVSPLPIPPVEKSVLVACTPERAFQAFTAEIAAWWPLATHSVGEDKATSVRIEPAIGGRVFETIADGRECEWGRVLTWSPPSGFAMSWHPGREPETQQRVTVSFTAEGAGTRVRLVHDGWAPSVEGQKARDAYHAGWDSVLGVRFAEYLRRA
jgi:uncharacterized protein YndB with AHSA1/START domain